MDKSPVHTPQPEGPEALLQRLDWTVLRPLDGLLQGGNRAWWRGAGVDLAGLREFQAHDDVRHIDWNVMARLNTPYVRQYHEDRDLTLWLLLDLSASMHCASGLRSKWQLAREFAGVMARVCTRQGNRVGALLYREQVDTFLPARHGRLQVLQLLQHLHNLAPMPTQAPASRRSKPPPGGTRLSELITAAQRTLKRRSCVLVVSDFISDDAWPAALARLSLRHDVTAIRLTDPLDTQLPEQGWLTVNDAETGEQLTLDTHDPALRARYTLAAQAFEAQLQQTLCSSGVDTLELSTQARLLDELLRFTDLRRRTTRWRASH